MPFAVTHMLVPLILLDIVRDNILKLKKEKLPNRYILIAGLFGLIPDIDLPFSLIIFGNTIAHRTLTHSIWFPLAFLAAGLIFWFLKNQKLFMIFLMSFLGFTSHIVLDFFLSGTVNLFYPLINFEYGLNLIPQQEAKKVLALSSIDAILLWVWFFKMEFRKRIEDFF